DAAISAKKQTTADNRRRSPCFGLWFWRALNACRRVHDYTGQKKTRAGHQERRDRLNGKEDSEISRTPDNVERGKSEDDPDLFRCVRHAGDTYPKRINVPVAPTPRAPVRSAD